MPAARADKAGGKAKLWRSAKTSSASKALNVNAIRIIAPLIQAADADQSAPASR